MLCPKKKAPSKEKKPTSKYARLLAAEIDGREIAVTVKFPPVPCVTCKESEGENPCALDTVVIVTLVYELLKLVSCSSRSIFSAWWNDPHRLGYLSIMQQLLPLEMCYACDG